MATGSFVAWWLGFGQAFEVLVVAGGPWALAPSEGRLGRRDLDDQTWSPAVDGAGGA